MTRSAVSAGSRRGAVAITSMTFIPGSSGTTTVKRPSVTSAGRPSTATADARGDTLPRTSAVPRRSVDPSVGAVTLQPHVLGRRRAADRPRRSPPATPTRGEREDGTGRAQIAART